MMNELKKLASHAKKVVFVSGNFNVVHPGHLRLLRFASECGDFLVVGVNGDASEGTTLPEEMRLEGVEAIGFVDYAFVLHGEPSQFIAEFKPDIVVMGKEHEHQHPPEKEAIERYGGKLLFGSGEVSFSSLELLHREYVEANLSTIAKPVDYSSRHGFSLQDLKGVLEKMVGLDVLVIGDLIVDEYVTCDPLGMSQEDPTIVVTPIESKRFLGGAGIVAAHAKGLGANVHFVTVAGQDEAAAYAERKLAEYGVNGRLFHDESRPTTLKKRYRAAGKTLLRVSHLRQHMISSDLAARVLQAVERLLNDCDVLIFSDFNYGCLPQELVDQIIHLAKQKGVRMAADSQSSSQMSDVSRFPGMMLLTPTEHEARLALRDSACGLAVLAERLAEKAAAKNVAITLGAEGVLGIAKDDRGKWRTDNLPAFNSTFKDVSGAGDSLLVCSAMALCASGDLWRSIYLGSIAAACQVSRIGNIPLTQADLIAEIDHPNS